MIFFTFRSRIITAVLVILFCFPVSDVFSEGGLNNSELRGCTREAINQITAFNFTEADQIISFIESEETDVCYSSFLKLYKFYWRFLLSPFDKDTTEQFRTCLEKTIHSCSSTRNENNPDAEIFRIISYIFISVMDHYEEKYISSFYWINKAGTEIEKLDMEISTTADIGFLQGCRDYYSLNSNYESALTNLKIAASDGYYFRGIASIMIADIYRTKFNNPDYLLALYTDLSGEYPGNPLLRYYLAKSLQHTGLYTESITTFRSAFNTINFSPLPVELMCNIHFSLGQIYEAEFEDYRSAASEYFATLNLANRSIRETQWFIPYSLLHIGICFQKTGDAESALYYLGQVQRSDSAEAFKRAQKIIRGINERFSQ